MAADLISHGILAHSFFATQGVGSDNECPRRPIALTNIDLRITLAILGAPALFVCTFRCLMLMNRPYQMSEAPRMIPRICETNPLMSTQVDYILQLQELQKIAPRWVFKVIERLSVSLKIAQISPTWTYQPCLRRTPVIIGSWIRFRRQCRIRDSVGHKPDVHLSLAEWQKVIPPHVLLKVRYHGYNQNPYFLPNECLPASYNY